MLEKASQLMKHAMRPKYGDSIWTPSMGSFYQMHARNIDGQDVPFSNYDGRVTLVMNTACGCGYTKGGYEFLSKISEAHEAQGLTVLAFPSNQFGKQEPGDSAQIKDFVKQFGGKFKLMEKIDVNGPHQSPVYTFLKSSFPGNADVTWNFGSSFVVNRSGVPVKRFGKESYDEVEKFLVEELKKPKEDLEKPSAK